MLDGDRAVDGLLGDGLQIRIEGGAHRGTGPGRIVLLLARGDDDTAAPDLLTALAVDAGEDLVLGKLQPRGPDELTVVLALMGEAQDVAGHGPCRVGAPGALVGLDTGDVQGLDPAPCVGGDLLSDDLVGPLTHESGPELERVDVEDRGELGGDRRRTVADNDLLVDPCGLVEAHLGALVLSDDGLVDADIVADRG